MTRVKPQSLKEARKMKRLDRFAKEHPSVGDEGVFDETLKAMASGKPPKARRISTEDASED